MSAQLAEVARRIGSLTSVIRTRSEDGVRIEVHGGSNGTLRARELAAVRRLEAVAEKLEKALA